MAKRMGMGCIAVVAMLVLAACQDWPQYMGNPSLTGAESGVTFVSPANVAQLTEAWTMPTGTSGSSFLAVAGGHLYAATGDGHLVASSTDGTTGCAGTPTVCQPLWTASLPGLDRGTAPAVANGVVFEDFYSSAHPTGTLAAFEANGVQNCAGTPTVCQPLWTTSLTTLAGVNVAGGVVYADDIPTESLEAFDANGVQNCSGTPTVCQPLWTAPIGALGVPSIANGRVYVASTITNQNWVAVFDAAGTTGCTGTPKVCQPLWKAAIPTSTAGSVDVSGGRGYVETGTSLVAFDANGSTNCSGSPVLCQPLWTASFAAPAPFVTPAVSGGHVFTAESASPGVLEAFDAAGVTGCSGFPVVCQPVWYSAGQTDQSAQWHSPMVVNGLVIENGRAYDANGALGCTTADIPICSPLWSGAGSATDVASTQQAIDQDTLFISETDGSVHAFRIPST